MKDSIIRELRQNEDIPYKLLLDADPSKSMVDSYLPNSKIYVMEWEGMTIGIYVLCAHSRPAAEIKNIAVLEEFQQKGLGKRLIADAEIRAKEMGFEEMIIGTGNSSIWQLYLYQRIGYDIYSTRLNFFTDNYPGPLYEHGICTKHMIMLRKKL